VNNSFKDEGCFFGIYGDVKNFYQSWKLTITQNVLCEKRGSLEEEKNVFSTKRFFGEPKIILLSQRKSPFGIIISKSIF